MSPPLWKSFAPPSTMTSFAHWASAHPAKRCAWPAPLRQLSFFAIGRCPRWDGAEFIERLRANEATSHLPVVLMSGYLPPDLKKLGATAFLQKPFQIEDVISLVTALATSNSSESEPELALGR